MQRTRQSLLALSVASALAWPGIGRAHDDDRFDFEAATGQWWQWALSIPASVNPLADTSGARCMVGQHGKLWFLAGAFSSNTITRTCSVPDNVALFFPVLNYVVVNTPGVCGDPGQSVKDMRALAAGAIDGAFGLSVTLDGKPVPNLRRVRSDLFATALPEDNLFDSDACNVPGRVFWPSIDDGYYTRINALPPGEHTLRFTGTTAGGFSLDVTYKLTVVRTSKGHDHH